MPGAGTIAPQRGASRDGATDHDIARRLGRARQIAARQRRARRARQAQQSVIEAIHPAPVRARSGGERKQAKARHASHGGDIAQSARQRLVAERFGRMRVVTKMHVFHQQIGGEKEVFARAPRTVDRAIVADSQRQAASHRQLRPAADGFQDFRLAARQEPTLPSRIWFLRKILYHIGLDRGIAICDNPSAKLEMVVCSAPPKVQRATSFRS